MDTTLISHLPNSTILTPTRRLASRLKQGANQYYVESGKFGWQTPCIFALQDWLDALWRQYEMAGDISHQLLTPTQSLFYWQYLIQSSETGKHLLHSATTAKMVAKAWLTLNQWLVLPLLEVSTENKDHAAFQEWARAYAVWLQDNHYCDHAQLMNILQPLLTLSSPTWQRVSPKPSLVLYGFDDFTPQESQFFESLSNNGWEVQSIDPVGCVPDKMVRLAFEQQRDEWEAAAKWAADLCKRGEKNIAIVVPTLVDNRLKIATIFQDALAPLERCQPDEEVNEFINLSAAIPLIQYPVIYAAIGYIKLAIKSLSLSSYAGLLRLPFSSGSESEKFLRASYAYYLKRHSAEFTGDDFIHQANKKSPPQWSAITEQFKQFVSQLPQKQTFSAWSKVVTACLNIFGWPGERALNSIEYQAVKRWYTLVNELGQCDAILPPVTFREALSVLEQLASNTPFQPENKKAPIQLLGILEAAGQQFDHLWIMGFHSEAWPPKAEPNPFIPVKIQRELNMPHAGPEKEMSFALKITERLKKSAAQIILSVPQQEKGRLLEPSELIQDIPLVGSNGATATTCSRVEDLFMEQMLERVIDVKAPPLQPAEMTLSASTLASQSACPFKAFAQFRLGARDVMWQNIWLAPPERGTLIHSILEDFWMECGQHANLIAMDDATLHQRISTLIEKNMRSMLPSNTPSLYREAEASRLYWLLQDYLAIEKQRMPFSVVALETEKHFTWGDVTFKLRVDRMDQAATGEIILIDYKTGKFDLNSLWGERPKEPQLPLYYLATHEHQPQTIVVAKVNTKKCEYIGISHQVSGIPGVIELTDSKNLDAPTSWDDLHAYWQEKIGGLVHSFQAGFAQVDPREGAQTCQFCHLHSVCRVHEYE